MGGCCTSTTPGATWSRKLAEGEHVSGPAAEEYRRRVSAATRFAGISVTTPAQVDNVLANVDLNVYHGDLLTCVWRLETAACREAGEDSDTPAWPRCRLSCRNIARTDRDIAAVTRQARQLRAEVNSLALPEPLRRRLQARLDHIDGVLADHQRTRPQPGESNDATGQATP